EGARREDPGSFPGGKAIDRPVGHLSQFHQANELLDPLFVLHIQAERYDGPDRDRPAYVARGREEGEQPAAAGKGSTVEVFTVDRDPALGPLDPRQCPEEAGFSAAIGPGEGNHLAAPDGERGRIEPPG